MRKTLTYSGLIIASLVVVGVFVTATTYTQLAIAIVLYPLLAYFAFKTLPHRIWEVHFKKPVIAIRPLVKSAEKVVNVEVTKPKIENIDIDRRAFLKLIGAAGLGAFLYSILNKRSEGSFFKSAAGPGIVSLEDTAGKKIDPAERQPMDGYQISEIDDKDITFYGFTNKDGAWFIIKEDTDTGTFRYVRGTSSFPGNWTRRQRLAYDYYNNVF